MRKKLTWMLTPLLVLAMSFSYAQEKTVSGNVTDQDGAPLPGVSIIVVGTTSGTQTDFDGNYAISVTEGGVLRFSYIGQATVDETVGSSNSINVQMQEDAEALEEVVVTGQGGVGINRRRISTTVDVIGAELIEKTPTKQLDQLLQASAPGAQIKLNSGQPGTSSIIRTRGPISAAGNTTPVIIVDGIRVDNLNTNASLALATGGAASSSIADIPLESIEKIEYVKGGAATTLYGADAANGVIQIITKKGTVGKPTITIEAETAVISGNERWTFFDRTGDLVFRNGTAQTYRFGLNGGSEAVRYNFSGSFNADDSFNTVNEQARRNFRAGFTAKITDRLTYTNSVTFSANEFTRDYNANNGFARFGNIEGGSFGNVDELSDAEFNDIKDQLELQGRLADITDRVRRFQTSNKFSYKFTDNFTVNALVGLEQRTNRQENIQTNAFLIAAGSAVEGTTDQGSVNRFTRDFLTVTGELNAQHKITVNDNFSFITSVGGQFFRNNEFQQQVVSSGVSDGAITVNGGEFTVQDFQTGFANYGAYISENIGLWDLVFVDLGLRIDGNTAFGDEIGLLYLPKAGASYSPSDHDFWENTFGTTFSTFKIRGNYGQATNFPQPFQGDLTFEPNNFLGLQTFTFDNPGNTELTSETVTTYEFGVDLGFFNNKVKLGATYYNGTTDDALFTPPQVPSSGQLAQVRNIGEIKNTGVELSLQTTIVNTEKHNLTFNASYNYNENEVVSSGGAPEFNVGGFQFLGAFVREGEPLGFLRGSRTTIVDGEAVIEQNAVLGQTFSPSFGNFSLSYTFNNKLSFFVNGDYQYGGQGVAVDDVLRFFGGVNDPARFGQDIDAFQAANADNPLSFFDLASTFVEDTDFIKIRNIGGSYNFGNLIKEIKDVKLGFNVSNPIALSSTTFDPEATGSGQGVAGQQGGFTGGGFGFGTESTPVVYTLSLKFSL